MEDPWTAKRTIAAKLAFSGAKVPLDAVRPGDFQEALRLLAELYHNGGSAEERAEVEDMLLRLQPEQGDDKP